jgi:alkylation response protein AidB-like acyl-CoA dehydrogenase
MHAPGIEIRPIRKISGQVEFAQVFYDDVRIPLENVVGGLGNGWKVAMSTLSFERGTGFIADQVKQSQEIAELLERARADRGDQGRPDRGSNSPRCAPRSRRSGR